MQTRNNRDVEQLDYKTCRSICDAVGERLQRSIRPETDLPSRLRELMDELGRRDRNRHHSYPR